MNIDWWRDVDEYSARAPLGHSLESSECVLKAPIGYDKERSERLTKVFRPTLQDAITAVGDPRRRAILRRIGSAELPVHEIADDFAVSRSAISQHLKVLVNAGFLSVRPMGRERLYRLRREGYLILQRFIDEFHVLTGGDPRVDRGKPQLGLTNRAGHHPSAI